MAKLVKPITPERAIFKTITLSQVPEDEESQLYTLMCVKSAVMLKKFIQKWGDCGRKLLVEVKYNLSNCPLTYLMIRDLVQDTERWDIPDAPQFGFVRYRFEDKKTDHYFTLYNHSRGISRGYYREDIEKYSKYDPASIKLYFKGEHEMFNDNEKVIVAKVLDTHATMLENLKELKRQQKIIKSTDTLKGLY